MNGTSAMRKLTGILALSMILCIACGKNNAAESEGELTFADDTDKVSYIIGWQIGSDLKMNGIEGLDVSRIVAAVDNAMKNEDPEITEEAMADVMGPFVTYLQAKRAGTEADASAIDYKKVSYIIGWQIGGDFKNSGVEDIRTKKFGRAIDDALQGKTSAIAETDMEPIMEVFMNDMRAKQEAKFAKEQIDNRIEASAYLAENAKKSGVTTLPDSLQYTVINAGTGPKPKAEDTVRVHYRGTYVDGSEFDSSYKRNEPAEFPVQGVISGWQEALQLMNVGSKWQVSIPPELAYGEMGRPGGIPPNKLLIFEMELIDIVKPE